MILAKYGQKIPAIRFNLHVQNNADKTTKQLIIMKTQHMKTEYHRVLKISLALFFFIAIVQISSAQSTAKEPIAQQEKKINASITETPINKEESGKMLQKNDIEVVDVNGNPCFKAYVPTTPIKKQEDDIILNQPK